MRLVLKQVAIVFVVYAILVLGLTWSLGVSRSWLAGEALIGVTLLAVIAITLHMQLARRAERLTTYIEDHLESRERSRAKPDEFQAVYRAAERMGVALNAARQTGETSSRRMGQLSDLLRVGLVWFQPDKTAEFANGRALELTGTPTFDDFRAEWDRVAAPVHAVMDRLSGAGMARSGPVEVQIGDPPRTVRILVYRIGSSDCEGFAGLITDPELIESLEEDVSLASQMRSLRPLMRTVAHELRSPLAAMIVNIDLLRQSLGNGDDVDASVAQERQRYVGLVQKEMERLNETLVGMVDQVSPPTLKPRAVDLGSLLRELAELIEAQAKRQHVELHLDEPEEPVFVMGRADHLKQVFLNLAVNALEAMREGGRLDVELRGREGIAEVQIRDTGPGIPMDLGDRIFEMGYSTKSEGGGTGLYVARTLLEQYQGTIRAEPVGGGGTVFHVSFPLAPEQPTTPRG